MPNLLKFVDKVDASPSVRLDINDGSNWFLAGADFSPPALRETRIASMLADGEAIPATAYNNRVIKLELEVKGTGGTPKDDLATRLQTLHRELDRKENVLLWQAAGATSPVFFLIKRSPGYQWAWPDEADEASNRYVLNLVLEAFPFAVGLKEQLWTDAAFDNDPATSGLFHNGSVCKGDVLTPAFIEIDPPSLLPRDLLVASSYRRGGTGFQFKQAEACTQGTDTTTQPNNATYSGAGNNFSRTTFATGGAGAWFPRLTWTAFPAAAGVNIRGAYKILARVKRSDNTSVMHASIKYSFATQPRVEIPKTTAFQFIDLGIVQVPAIDDPVTEGYSNIEQPVGVSDLLIQAGRDSGSGTLDWDYIVAVPADCETALLHYWAPSTEEIVIDGPRDKAYQRDKTSGNLSVLLGTWLERSGGFPRLSPVVANQLVLLIALDSDDVTDTFPVTVSYWPLYLEIRPAST